MGGKNCIVLVKMSAKICTFMTPNKKSRGVGWGGGGEKEKQQQASKPPKMCNQAICIKLKIPTRMVTKIQVQETRKKLRGYRNDSTIQFTPFSRVTFPS